MIVCPVCTRTVPTPRPGQRYCSVRCQSTAATAAGKNVHHLPRHKPEASETPSKRRLEADEVRALVFGYHLPEPYTLDPATGQPLWQFSELAELFGLGEFELADVLTASGQRFLNVPVGTSARMLASA